ncbi:MAG: DUF507 family protein [Helicobacteraceae bacterium]
MKIKANQAELVAARIARDLMNNKLVKFSQGMDPATAAIKTVLLEDIQKEQEIDAEAYEILEENDEEIEFQRVDRKQLFWMIKKKICEEDGFIFDKEDRYNNISHLVLNKLYDEDLILFDVSENRIISQILRSIFDFGKAQESVEDRVREKILSLKRQIKRGTEEYDILFEKYFVEEMNKIGM